LAVLWAIGITVLWPILEHSASISLLSLVKVSVRDFQNIIRQDHSYYLMFPTPKTSPIPPGRGLVRLAYTERTFVLSEEDVTPESCDSSGDTVRRCFLSRGSGC